MDGLTGRMLGPYRILGRLGRGGMAEVYKAYQPSLDRYVAVKVMYAHLADDSTFVQRFEQEARAVARLQHPNILQVFDFGIEGDHYYMVMPFVDGVTLKARLSQGIPLPPAETVRIVAAVAEALDYAHGEGMVHRDIKSSNIMINRGGAVFLTDFGIAKMVQGPQVTVAGSAIGTPEYMSPEQCLGEKLDGRSDLYSLGIVLYELVTGQVPFTADTPYAVVTAQVTRPLPLPRELTPALPEAVEKVILRALAKRPEDRFQSGGEFAAAVRGMLPAWEASQTGGDREAVGDLEIQGPPTEAGLAVRRGGALRYRGLGELTLKIILAALGAVILLCGAAVFVNALVSDTIENRLDSAQGSVILCLIPGSVLLVTAGMLQFRTRREEISPWFLTSLGLVCFAVFSGLCGTTWLIGTPFQDVESQMGSLVIGLPCLGLGAIALVAGVVFWLVERKKARQAREGLAQ